MPLLPGILIVLGVVSVASLILNAIGGEKTETGDGPPDPKSPDSMHQRISALEKESRRRRQDPPPTPPDDGDDPPDGFADDEGGEA